MSYLRGDELRLGELWLTITATPSLFSVNIASKGLSFYVNHLESTVTSEQVNTDSKWFTRERDSIHFGARLGGLRAQYLDIQKEKAATGLPQSNAKIIPNGIIAKIPRCSREISESLANSLYSLQRAIDLNGRDFLEARRNIRSESR
jgi:hypothetical protein